MLHQHQHRLVWILLGRGRRVWNLAESLFIVFIVLVFGGCFDWRFLNFRETGGEQKACLLLDCRQFSLVVFAEPVLHFNFLEDKGFHRIGNGKSREVFESDALRANQILFATTDRISAFDRVLPGGIRQKGEILTQMSDFWFARLKGIIRNHRQGIGAEEWPKKLEEEKDWWRRRVVVVWRAKPLPVECVVRGHLAGSAWREYQKTGEVCGVRLPKGLRESEELPEPIFTPTTKAKSHDEPIAYRAVENRFGRETAEKVRDYSLKLYRSARKFARTKGVLIADTKFEFGIGAQDGELLLIDEALTPDSSRFWLAAKHRPGMPQESFDKQMVRDYLQRTGWDKKSPAPRLPAEVAEETRSRYMKIYQTMTGESAE